MSILAEDEIRDYEKTIISLGRKTEEFKLIQSTDPIPPATVYPITGNVIIKHNKSNKSITYKAGHGSSWIVDFENDLKRGFFD